MNNTKNNNDLSNVNGLIYTAKNGWENAVDNKEEVDYPILTENEKYTICGRLHVDDKHPSAWLEPPEYLNAESKPCELKKGDMVIAKFNIDDVERKRYFSHHEKGNYYCYSDGMTEWSSEGRVSFFPICEKA